MAEADTQPVPAPSPGENGGADQPKSDSAPPKTQDFDTLFPDKPQNFDTLFPQRQSLDLPRPLDGQDWKDYLHNAPAGRIISAFGDAFTGPGIYEEGTEWLRKAGIYNDVNDLQKQHYDTFAQSIIRPIVVGNKKLSQYMISPFLYAADVAMRTAQGIMVNMPAEASAIAGENTLTPEAAAAIGHPGESIKSDPLHLEGLFKDIAGAGQMTLEGALFGLHTPHLPPRVAAARSAAVIGEGEAGYMGTRPPTDAELQARTAAASDYTGAAHIVPEDVNKWADGRLDSIEAKANGTAEIKTVGPDGKPMIIPAQQPELLTHAEITERDFLRRNKGDHEAVLRAYPNLAQHLWPAAASDGLRETARQMGGEPAAQEVSAQTPATPSVHAVARAVDPETFKEFDELAGRKSLQRQWLDQLSQERAAGPAPEGLADIDRQIAETERKSENAGARMQKRYADQIEDLHDQRNRMLEEHLTTDTPAMAQVRKDLMATDYAMRDLAPKVSAAYREAAGRMPQAEEFTGEHPVDVAPSAPGGAEASGAPGVVSGEPAAAKGTPEAAAPAGARDPNAQHSLADQLHKTVADLNAQTAQLQAIADDVKKKLTAVGRSSEEANNAAQIIAAYYETRAQRLGNKWTPKQLYDRDAPAVRAGRQRALEMAQRPGQEFRQGGEVTQGDVDQLQKELADRHGLSHLSMALHQTGDLHISMIEVPKEARGKGAGTAAMQEIAKFADENGLRVTLSPGLKDDLHGTTSRGRLVDFYKRFGFVENKGRRKDFSISAGMYREPRSFDQPKVPLATETPEFKAWFGDSKIVDGDGKPEIVYHGGAADTDTLGPHTFFGDRPTASSYANDRGHEGGGVVYPVYLKIEKPATEANIREAAEKVGAAHGEVDQHPLFSFVSPNMGAFYKPEEVIAELKRQGFDGAVLDSDYAMDNPFSEVRSYTVFEPTQIKSVFNRGTFSPTDARMLYQEGREKPSDQLEVPGSAASAKQAAEARSDRLKGKVPQKGADEGGLFGDGHKQRTLFQPAYHGSPYHFDKFTLDHIGEGEGAQAFGHGLYFAGNKKVADFYRQKLALGGRQFTHKAHAVAIMRDGEARPLNMNGDWDGPAAALIDFALKNNLTDSTELRGAVAHALKDQGFFKRIFGDVAAAHVMLEALHGKDVVVTKPPKQGRLYHVDLAPQPHEWIDGDKPFDQQSQHIQDAFKALGLEPAASEQVAPGVHVVESGLSAYFRLAEKLSGPAPDESGMRGWTHPVQTINGYRANMRAASEALKKAGVPGIKYKDAMSRGGRGEGTHNFVVFDAGDVTIKAYEQPKRGSIRFLDDGRKVITMMRDADASTFMHETSHGWLEDMMKDAELEHAAPELKADAQTVREWLGVGEDGKITRGQHEKWARGWERYLMEGRAPTQALAKVFAKFKDWLTKIYRTASKLNAPINDDIRDVFDRMLSKNPERTSIVPEEPELKTAGDLHAEDSHAAHPNDAAAVGDRIHTEFANAAKANVPEIANALELEPAPETPAGAAEHPNPDRGVDAARPVAEAESGRERPGEVGTGGGTGPAKGGKPRGRRSGLYTTVPREPTRLTSFIQRLGGIAGDRGDLKAILGSKNARPGLFNEKTGVSLDDAALSAWENGYFPEFQERPSIDDLLKRMELDLRGSPQYSDFARDDVAAYNDALARNAEVDRVAHDLGIDQTAMSSDEFWDKVAERMSEEERDALSASFTEAMEDGIAEAERLTDEFYRDPGRGLDDGAQDGERRTGEAGAAGQHPRPLETGEGQRGGGNGTQGGSRPPKEPTGAEQELIEKAGNIRLDLLNQPEDIDAAIRQVAHDNAEFEGDRFGEPGRQLYNLILSSRALLAKTAAATVEAARAFAEDATPENLEAADLAKSRQTMVQRRLAILTHNWGLAGQAFRDLEGLPNITKDVTVADLMERTQGLTLYQRAQQIQLFNELETNAQRARFLEKMSMTPWQKVRSGIIELFVNNLISGPLTHMAYSIGNESMNLFRVGVETPIAAAINSVRGRGAGEAIYSGEVKSLLARYTKGAADGWAAASKAWKTGVAQALPGELEALGPEGREQWEARHMPNEGAIPGRTGEIIRLPSHAVAAIHSFGRAMTAAQEMWRLAYRSASDLGLTGEAADRHIAEFIRNPTPEMLEKVNEAATKSVLMQRAEYGTAFYHLKQITEKNLAAKIVAPFMQIGANLLSEGYLERTPLGVIDKPIRDNLLGRNGTVAQDMQMSKMAAGIGLSGAVVYATLNGIVSGGGPSDYKERAVLMATGWQPYAVKSGEHWVPFRKYLGPLGPLIAGVADMAEIAHNAKEGQLGSAAWAAVAGLSQVIADESWFRGVSNFVNAVRNYDNPEGGRYLRDLATDFIPFAVGLSQVSRMIDPYSRHIGGIVDGVKAHVPVLSQTLSPRRDVLGDEIPSRQMISPSAINQDPVLAAMLKAQVYPTAVSRKIRGVELTDQQYDDLAALAGRMAKGSLRGMVSNPAWDTIPLHIRHKMMADKFNHAREAARSAVMLQSHGTDNDIMQKALDNKRATRDALDNEDLVK